MKNKIQYILILFLLLTGASVYGQQSWKWGYRFKGGGNVVVDSHGNSYVAWRFDGTYPLEGGHTISTDSGDCVLTKYSCNGTYLWSRVFGVDSGCGSCVFTVGYGTASAYGVDSFGGVYITGSFVGENGHPSFHIGDTTIPIPGGSFPPAYLAKFDTSGNFKWIKTLHDTFSPTAQNGLGLSPLSVLPDGTSYFKAMLPSGIYGEGADTFTATYPGGEHGYMSGLYYQNDLYILKYDKDGRLISGHHLDIYAAGGGLYGSHFSRDKTTGSYYMSGTLEPSVYADTLRLGDSVLTTGGGQAGPAPHVVAYIARFDSAGNFRWVTKQSYSNNQDIATHIAGNTIDNSGNIYLSGATFSGVGFGPFTFHNALSNLAYSIPILVEVSPNGTLLNAINASANNGASLGPIKFNHGVIGLSNGWEGKLQWGNLTAHAASNHANIALARFNPANLSVMSLDSIVGIPTNVPPMPGSLTADSKGDFYLSGNFPSALYVANDTLYNQSPVADGFVAKFGFSNCNCNPPVANFSYAGGAEADTPITFTYTGQTPVDSVLWSFGDTIPATGNQVTHTFTEAGTYMVCATAYNHCGSNMHCESIELFPMGIDKIPGFAQISVYPNPATQTLHISHAPAGTDLGIYNMMGVQVLHTVLRGNKDEVSVGGLAPGVYILQFTDQNGRRGMTKFVKE